MWRVRRFVGGRNFAGLVGEGSFGEGWGGNEPGLVYEGAEYGAHFPRFGILFVLDLIHASL